MVPAQVDVLGPLRLTVDGQEVTVPGPKRRTLLARLAMGGGRVVSVDDLLDALWPSDIPDSALASLHSHVSRLRGHLGSATTIEQTGGGYRLRLGGPDGSSDVERVRRALVEASGAAPEDARRILEGARACWRGDPLTEFADVDSLAAWAVSLRELRRTVDEALVESLLEMGAVPDAVVSASSLVGDDPLSESGALLLMRSLAAAGRAADALRYGHEFRRRLADVAGLDPSDAVRDLEREIATKTTPERSGLARPSGRLRGRESELAAVRRLLERERLVTILGPGGVGKTRLATEAAIRSERTVALLLSSVPDASGIPRALAAALDLEVVSGDVLDACAALLAPGRQLLLVDNCEHLLAATSEVLAALLEACPGLTVLATSREPLDLPSEQQFRLAPLPLPVSDAAQDLERSPATAIFVDRARRVRADFELDGDTAVLVADIVRRLDGMPLAIELAAGRLSSLGVEDLRDRLDRALDLLGDDSALRRTIDWSYALLPPDEQRLLRHLAVFPDGFDLTTAETVATAIDDRSDPARALAHLVDASMLEAGLGRTTRYRMLDLVRTFACEQLDDKHERDAADRRFLRWAVELAAWIDRTCATEREPEADHVLRREAGNLRAAWGLARTSADLDACVALIVGLVDVATWRDITEIWDWSLDLATDEALSSHTDAATVLGLAATSAWSRGDLAGSDALARRALAIDADCSFGHAALALAALSDGDFGAAIRDGTAAAERSARPDQSLGVAALAAAYDGDLRLADELHHRSASDNCGSPTIDAFHHYVAGEIATRRGAFDDAETSYLRAMGIAESTGATLVTGIASVGLQSLRVNTGRVGDALEGFRHLLDHWERTGSWLQQWTTLRNLARLLDDLGERETADLIERSADAAPDAPRVAGAVAPRRSAARRIPHVGNPSDIGRARVLEIARAAIGRRQSSETEISSKSRTNRDEPAGQASDG